VDSEIESIADYLISLDPTGARTARALRRTYDMLLDGQHTGRYRWEQLHKTEKTHCGTLVEINLQREFTFSDGQILDYSILGSEVDCKYSDRLAAWMIPPEATGHVLLGVWANDLKGRWSAGLVRATPDHLNAGANRDAKRTLNVAGRKSIRWLHHNAPLPENILLHLPAEDVIAIFGKKSGQQKVNELFRRAIGRIVSRTVVATVAEQEDYMKRVRGNLGARSHLKSEGIVILGQYGSHTAIADSLGLPIAGSGEFVSARVTRRTAAHAGLPSAYIEGTHWVLWRAGDPLEEAPLLPDTRKA